MKAPTSQMKWMLCLLALMLSIIPLASCAPVNSYPVISSLQAKKASVPPSGSCEVSLVASDADGDSLTYAWSATGGTFNGTGPVTTWTAPDMPGAYTLTVKVADGRGGEATKQLTIDVIDNSSPVIESLTAESLIVKQSGSTEITCVADDPDGDELTYKWTTNKGTLSWTGPVATWTAPDTLGAYAVAVKVTDGKGGEVIMQLLIDVTDNSPPVIESLTAQSPVVLQGGNTKISCVANDPDGDELTYTWTSERGNFSGQDATVTWIAPFACTTYVISVTVTDGRGGEASQELDIKVKKPG